MNWCKKKYIYFIVLNTARISIAVNKSVNTSNQLFCCDIDIMTEVLIIMPVQNEGGFKWVVTMSNEINNLKRC